MKFPISDNSGGTTFDPISKKFKLTRINKKFYIELKSLEDLAILNKIVDCPIIFNSVENNELSIIIDDNIERESFHEIRN